MATVPSRAIPQRDRPPKVLVRLVVPTDGSHHHVRQAAGDHHHGVQRSRRTLRRTCRGTRCRRSRKCSGRWARARRMPSPPLRARVPNRPCLDCGRIASGTRCAECKSQKERQRGELRGSTTQRGYGAPHQRRRHQWAPRVAAGLVACARCGEPIEPGEAWDLGHPSDRPGAYAPEHARRCNRSAGGRAAH